MLLPHHRKDSSVLVLFSTSSNIKFKVKMDEFGKNNVIIVFVDINYTNLHYQFDHVANPFKYVNF